ncbi:MAG: hypothetical protein OSA84_06620 [Akkermansiaceae bacterium]|nr:hypothetical protein [Akkermansiaceae bacterium]
MENEPALSASTWAAAAMRLNLSSTFGGTLDSISEKTLVITAFQFSELRPYPVAEIPVAAFKAVVQRFLPISEPNSEPSLQVFHGREGRGLRLIAGDFLDLRGKPLRLMTLDRGGLLELLAGIFIAVGVILQSLDTSLGDKQPILELVGIG